MTQTALRALSHAFRFHFGLMVSLWPYGFTLALWFRFGLCCICPASCGPPECISGPAGDGGRKDYIQLKIGRRKAASAWSNSGETACFYKSYKRGLLFQSHKRKIGGEENLISAVGIGSWRSPCPMRTKPTCPHNDEIRTTGLLYPLP